MGYMKNKDKLDSIQADTALDFEVRFLERMLDSKNKIGGALLHVILRSLVNLAEVKTDTLARVGLVRALKRVVCGALVERDYWKPAANNDEYCSHEKALAVKCLYPFAIHQQHSKAIVADEPLLKGTVILLSVMLPQYANEALDV